MPMHQSLNASTFPIGYVPPIEFGRKPIKVTLARDDVRVGRSRAVIGQKWYNNSLTHVRGYPTRVSNQKEVQQGCKRTDHCYRSLTSLLALHTHVVTSNLFA